MRIDHVAIWTKDLERLKTFYMHYFGGIAGEKYHNVTKSFESYFITFDSGARLELMQMPTIPMRSDDLTSQFMGLIHIAISVGTREKVDSLTSELVEAGYKLVSEARYTGDGYYESCILDPDGNRIEITV